MKKVQYWILVCSSLMGGVSLIRTGDPVRIIGAAIIGAVIGVVLYGSYITFSSAISSVDKNSLKNGIKINKIFWLVIFFVTVVVQATQSNFLFALGATIPWFIAGMIFSPIWWGVTKKNRKSPWQWFDWMNAGAYIMVVLFALSLIVKVWLASQGVR